LLKRNLHFDSSKDGMQNSGISFEIGWDPDLHLRYRYLRDLIERDR